MTDYSKTSHTVFHHRFHIVWITKYRKRILSGQLRIRIREIIAQAADSVGVKIVNGVLSSDHVHIFAEIPPHLCLHLWDGKTPSPLGEYFSMMLYYDLPERTSYDL